MARGAKTHDDDRQGDLFAQAEQMFPVRQPEVRLRSGDFSLRIKSAMSSAIKECPSPQHIVAAEIAELTGRPLTADALRAYTAPSKEDHDIGITRFSALVTVTRATWLLDVLAESHGVTLLEGREARLAQLGLLSQRRRQIDEKIRQLDAELASAPVILGRRRP